MDPRSLATIRQGCAKNPLRWVKKIELCSDSLLITEYKAQPPSSSLRQTHSLHQSWENLFQQQAKCKEENGTTLPTKDSNRYIQSLPKVSHTHIFSVIARFSQGKRFSSIFTNFAEMPLFSNNTYNNNLVRNNSLIACFHCFYRWQDLNGWRTTRRSYSALLLTAADRSKNKSFQHQSFKLLVQW